LIGPSASIWNRAAFRRILRPKERVMEISGKHARVAWGERTTIAGEEAGQKAAGEHGPIEQKKSARTPKSHAELRGILVEDGDGHLPPEAVARAAQKGLALREKLRRTGTTLNVAHARELKDRKRLPDATVRNMARFFARHEVDKRPQNWGEDDKPSAGYVTWLLWGGDPGREWAEGRVALLDED